MNSSNKKVVTRFAPSPTGFLHVGSLRTAIYAWLWARKNNGTFILRIEDTDKEREVAGSIKHIIESLGWLNIDYDKGPYKQSERLDIYKKYALKLIEKGCAYADPFTEEHVEEFRKKAEAEKKPFLFRDHRPKKFEEWDGTKPLRFKVNNIKRYEWNDLVFGDLSAGEEALDDFILIKSDGFPTYNFAHIVDDIEMEVTHVMRGQEFIASTPKFLSLYEALEIEPPLFATLPPIMGESGNKKLSKRDGAKDVLEYRNEGYLPEAMLNFLAFLGWNPGTEQEIFSVSELKNEFDISRIQKGGAKFNDIKLDWFNREHLKKLSYEEQEEYLNKFIPDILKDIPKDMTEIMHNLVPVIMERISKGKDIIDMVSNGELTYVFGKPNVDKELLIWKSVKDNPDKYKVTVEALNHSLKTLENSSGDNIHDDIWPLTEKYGRGEILWPLRVALSGLEKSPDPFTIIKILGKEETITRVKAAILILSK